MYRLGAENLAKRAPVSAVHLGPVLRPQTRRPALEVLDQPRQCEAGRILHQPVNVVVLAVARDERGATVGAKLAEDLAQIGNSKVTQHVATVLADKNQVCIKRADAVS